MIVLSHQLGHISPTWHCFQLPSPFSWACYQNKGFGLHQEKNMLFWRQRMLIPYKFYFKGKLFSKMTYKHYSFETHCYKISLLCIIIFQSCWPILYNNFIKWNNRRLASILMLHQPYIYSVSWIIQVKPIYHILQRYSF